MTELLRELKKSLPGLAYIENEPLSAHTTFRIGGPCDLMLLPASQEELGAVLRVLSGLEIRPFLLGAGSNLLMPDEGFRGVVISTRDCLTAVSEPEHCILRAEAGVTLTRLANLACEKGLTGLEFAQGIPGTLGGGVYMNAGAYGGELKQVIRSVDYFTPDGVLHRAAGEELAFGYRDSMFAHRPCAVAAAELLLQPGNPEEIRAKMRELAVRRREKQPLEYPSAGSAFRRPEGHFAGALIEQAGLKGLQVGGAAVSEKHAGFIVNLGGATAADVKQLIGQVQARVLEASGVLLEPEIRMIENQEV